MTHAHEIAAWRFEQIAPLVDPSLNRARLRAALRARTSQPIEWPQSKRRKARGDPPLLKPIPKSTLFRWLRAWREKGYEGLLPAPRVERRTSRRERVERWILYAIGLLYEQPERSLSQLGVYLELEFEDYDLSRATLARHLGAHPAYSGAKALRSGKSRRLRDLYEASAPHECWQLDGKGPFHVRLKDGTRIAVHVLSILDDYSRAILAVHVANAESTEAAIAVFQKAAAKYGLPDRFQFDRGSAFDSHAFREGIARLGVHRNAVKAKNPQAQGKIEAYHRSLGRWFVVELRAQEVCDLEHLGELCEALIHLVYNRHHHRSIGCAPAKRLGERVSERKASVDQLARAFFVETSAKSHPKTAEVRLANGIFRVPMAYAGRRCRFRHDPIRPDHAVLVGAGGKEIELELFTRKPLPILGTKRAPKRGVGALQKLVDLWQGKERPNAQPGFGLPEVFLELAALVGRPLPTSQREGRDVLAFYRRFGPLACDPFRAACRRAKGALGEGRPLSAYLNRLEREILSDAEQSESQVDEELRS
jgi:transposase InsO family protein